MATLMDTIKGFITPELIGQAASHLGTSEENTGSGLATAVPAILAGLLNKSTTNEGASEIFSSIKQNGMDGSLLGNLGGLFGSSNNSGGVNWMGLGAQLLPMIFGDRLSGITNFLGRANGMGESGTSSLLSMAAPLIMSVLGKKVTDEGMGVSGLMNLFSNEKSSIMDALPAGLSNLLGSSTPTPPVVEAAVPPTYSRTPEYTPPTPAPVHMDEPASGTPRWLWPLLILALAAGLIWWMMRGCNKETTSADTTTTTEMVDTVSSVASDVGDANGLGAFGARKLPDGVELNIPANGIENKLIAFIEDANRAVDKTTWFSFDRLEFETGKSMLKPSSQEQLKNIAAIMKAYPNVNIKLGGYTDNTGDPKANLKLSGDRASSAMKELVTLGVAANRLEAEGYGDQYPVASNDTEEGRARNRRVDVRVTKK